MEGALSIRYLLLLMGIFSSYCGLVYNDFMSIPIFHSWGSCFELPEGYGQEGEGHAEKIHNIAKLKEDCTPPIGVDPVWYLSSNSLTYLNSLKMKLAVILGVA